MNDGIEAIYPLSPTQQGMLFHTIEAPGSGVYVGQVSCRLGGELDLGALEEAWQRLVDRHAALRTSFVWRRVEEARQVVHRRVRVGLHRLDWTGVPGEERSARLEAYLDADRRRGFDVARAPLMRLTVIQLEEQAWHLVWTQHHLLIDGWCQHLLLRESFAFYQALRRGEEVVLPPARPYRDYIAWLRRQSLSDAEAYWRRTLRGFTAPTPLSVDRHPGAAGQGTDGVCHQVRALPASTTAALRNLARDHQLTLNTVVQGAWALLLSRYSSEDDVVFGVVVAGRPVELDGVESMVGLFVNTLPLRVRVPPEAEVLRWLRALQLQQAEMSQYEASPLVRVQAWSEVPRGRPLFESIFIFENYPPLDSIEERLGDLQVSQVRAVDHTSYPLAVFASGAETLTLRISYDPGRFEHDTIQRMLGHLGALLEGIVAHPRAALGRLSLLTPDERERVLIRWNETRAAFPEDRCVHQLFEAQVERTPEALAAVFGAETVTYRELNRRANRLGHRLRSVGVGPEVRVGLYVERSLELVVGVLGILKAGGAYVPLDTGYPPERLRFMLEDAEAPVLVTQARLLGRLPASDARPVCLDGEASGLDAESDENPAVGVAPEHLAYVMYTSGSTGRPKGVAMGHRSLGNLLAWQLGSSTPRGGARTLQFAALGFDVCFQEIFSTLCSGGTLILIPEDMRRDPWQLMGLIAEHRVDRLFVPFTALQQLSEAADGGDGVATRLQEIITAGEPLHITPSIARWLGTREGAVLHNQYGPTESHVVTALTLAGPPTDWPRLPPIGRPIANAHIYILDAALDPTPVGVPGELCIGGAGLARGYHRRPELTAERFIPNPFSRYPGDRLYRTGDLARWRADGALEFLGRMDHQVKIRGFRVELGEIEAVLAEHPAVREAVVALREEASGSRKLVGYVVADPAQSPTTSELRHFLGSKLPEYMVPAVFVTLDALPLSPNGKVDRRALPAPEGWRPDLQETFVAPRTPVEEQLAGIWSRVLGVDRVGVNDNFFELGGDSIQSLQIVAQAREAGLRLTPRQLFQHQTIAELAAVVGRARAIQAEQGPVTGPVPLTPIQRWFFEQEYPEPHHCNMAVLLEVRPDLDARYLGLALEHLLLHHDALRLRYERREDGWAQVNADVPDIAGQKVFTVVDLSGFPDGERTRILEATAAGVQASLNLTEGPVLRVALFRMGGASDRLLLVVHHLVVDGVSWRIIWEDLMTAYRHLSQGEPVRLPPKTTSFRYWAERLQAWAQSPALGEEAAYWLGVVGRPVSPLPRDHDGGVNDAASADTVEVSLSSEETRALLHDVPPAYRTQINDVLLTALAQAFARWTGKDSLLLDLEGHGREELFEDVDLSRTVGWFTALFPVRLELEGATAPGDALKSIKEELRRIPRRGVGYGLLCYARDDAELGPTLREGARAEVTFNYLGQFDHVVADAAGLGLAKESSGPPFGLSNRRAYLLEINGGIAGGQLRMLWRYSRQIHERATVERLAGDFIEALRALIAHCQSPEAGGCTPSDFPLARLDQATLDRLTGSDRGVEDIYPLSPMQAGLLFHSLFAPDAAVYFEQVSCTLEGELDVEALRAAWQRAVDRHPILRTGFAWEGLPEPLQIVRHRVSVPWQVEDWRGLPAVDQARGIEAFLRADLARGFDLARPPLMRLALIRLGAETWKFVWSRHHLLLDGWSGSLLLAEGLRSYDAYARREEVALERPRPYRDFIAWLRTQDLTRAEAFWRAMLAGVAAPTPLPIGRAEGSGPSAPDESAREDLTLPAGATARLEEFARRHQLTLGTLVQGAWALLLGRYSGEDEVVFGVTVSGRPADFEGIGSMLGVFINTLPLRVPVAGREGLLPWLGALQERLAEARQYEFTPLAQIQGWSEVPRGVPLFESIVVFENYPVERWLEHYRGELRVRDGRFRARTNYPLTLVVEPGAELSLHLLYDRRLLGEALAARMLRHFATALQSLGEAPGRCLSEVSILTAEEETRLLVGSDGGRPAASRPVSLHEMFEARAKRAPEAVAVVDRDQRITYAELDARANGIADHLRALGAGPQGVVAVLVEPGPLAVEAMLGVLKAGAAVLPLDPRDAGARRQALLGDARPLLVLTQDHLRDRLDQTGWPVVILDGPAEATAPGPATNPPARPDPGWIAYVDSSGGEVIAVEHHAAVHRVEMLQQAVPLAEGDAVQSTAPPGTDAFVLLTLWPLLYGARAVLVDGAAGARARTGGYSDAPLACVISDAGVTVVQGLGRRGPPHGAGCRVVSLWGAPEAGWIVSEATEGDGVERVATRAPGGLGLPVIVLDRDLRPLPEGLWGEVSLGGAGLARGYLNDLQKTRERFVEGRWAAAPSLRLFRTGARGRLLSDGTLEIAAAGPEAWIDGFRVEPERVAAALLRDPSVEDCVVLARETESRQTWLVAYVVGRGGVATDTLRNQLPEILPASLSSRIAFVQVSSIPLTAAGGVDDAALCRLDVVDSDLVGRWEERLRTLPEVDRALVLVEDEALSWPPLHLGDLLPGDLRLSSRGAPGAADRPSPVKPARAPEAGGSGLPAICHGARLAEEADAPRTLSEALRRAAREEPRQGLVYLRSDGSEIVQSYPELLETAERILGGLRGLGLEPQDNVIFQLNDNRDFVPAFWGCVLGGFVPVPVSIPPTYRNPNGALTKLHQAWDMLGRPVVLAGGELAAELRSWSKQSGLEGFELAQFGELAASPRATTWHRGRPDEVALILLTSGSTGRPKGVMLTHSNLLSRSAASKQMNLLTGEEVTLNWIPLDHVGGIVYFHIRDVYLACRQIHAAADRVLQDPLRWLDWIDRYRVTITWAPNFAFGLINERAEEIRRRHWDLSSVRFIFNGGEAVIARTARRFLQLLAPHQLSGAVMHPAWGMSETSSGVTYSKRFSLDSSSDDAPWVAVGDPIPGISLRIVDDADEIVEMGRIGRLQVKGLTVTPGYYGGEELNREAFTRDGWFRTGDLGFLSREGLTITGREKDVLLINGVNYSCHEIEAVVEEIDGVAVSYTAACAVRLPDGGPEQMAVFFSCSAAAADQPLPLIDRIRQQVVRKVGVRPDYVIPVAPDIIPKTAIGKIQRAELRRRFEAGEFDAIVRQIDIETGSARTIPDWFYTRIWRRRDATAGPLSPRRSLVLLDRLGLGAHLCDELDRSLPPAVRVEAGAEFARLGPRRYRIHPADPAHYRRLLAELAEDGVEVDQVVHLLTYDEPRGEVGGPAALDQAQEEGLLSLLFLVQALAETRKAQEAHPVDVLVVGSHVQPVFAADLVAPEKSPILGLIRTVPHELPWISCRHLDLPVDEVGWNAALIRRELDQGGAEAEVAYRGGRRFVPRLKKVSFRPKGEAEAAPFRTGGMYLVTGGLGGIGTEIARYLLERHQAAVLLVGRTALPERDRWVHHLAMADGIAQRIQVYLALERSGGRIAYEAVDVSDETGVRQAVERWTSRWKCELAGIIHLAGVLSERLLVEETRDSIAATLRPKLLGSWVLDQLLRDHPGSLFIHFASVNGTFGGATMGAYAAANCFLDSFSRYQNARAAGSSYCFAWSVWDGVGMSRAYLAREHGRARGYQPVSVDQGLSSLLIGLGHRQTSLLVGLDGGNRNIRRRVATDSGRARRLAAYVTARPGGELPAPPPDVVVHDRFGVRSQCDIVPIPEMPLAAGGEVDREALARFRRGGARVVADRVLPRTDIERRIARIWQEVLRRPQVGIHDNFFELGGDSILAIQAMSRAHQAGLRFRPAQLFQRQTIASLAAVIEATAEVHGEQGPVVGPVPLTPIQHWFFEQHLPEAHHFNMTLLLRVGPQFDPSLMEAVVGRILVHHDALRLRFAPDGSGWRQWQAGPEEAGARPVFVRVMLADVPEAEQGAAIEAAAADLQASLDLAQGPVIRVAHIDLGRGVPGRLLVITHHLVIDGVSWRILLEDLLLAYGQLSRGLEVTLPPKTTSFQSWSGRLSELADSEAIREELGFWLGIADVPVPPLPVDHPAGPNTVGRARRVSVRLDREETRALLEEIPGAYHTQINDVLLTALGEALARWTGHRSVLLDVEGHGREEIVGGVDLSRTVGWLTALYPVRLDLPPTWSAGKALPAIKEQLRRVPNRGIGFGMLRYLAADGAIRERMRALPEPEVSFNYLGQVDAPAAEGAVLGLGLAPESVGPLASPHGARRHLLDVVAWVAEGCLQADWVFSPAIHEASAIERLAEAFVGVLREIIAHCQSAEAGGYTPSDFPLAALDEQELRALLAQVEFEGEEPA